MSSAPEGFSGHFQVGIHGQVDQLDGGQHFLHLPARVQAVQDGHGHIDHDTSGFNSPAARTRARPSLTIPTTSNSVSRSFLHNSATRVWSSAIKMRDRLVMREL